MPTTKPMRMLKHLSMMLRGQVSGWVIGGVLIAVTGFTPQEWIARLFHDFAAPADVHSLLPLALDARVLIVLIGIAIIVADVLNRSRHRNAAEPGRDAARHIADNPPSPEDRAEPLPHTRMAPVADDPSEGKALPLPHKPSIAILPFENMSGPEQAYFADGITEDIITALSRFRWFFVIARNSSFVYKDKAIDVKQVARELGVRYVLEGSVRRSAGRVRISVQLIDASIGAHIWAEQYDRELIDIFAVQDEITEQVAGAIEPELLKMEGHAAMNRTDSASAWDLVRQGTWYFHQVTRDTHFRARELFRKAIEFDPKLPEAHIWLARASAGFVAYGWSDDPAAELGEGMQAALEAVQLDERNPYSHYALAIVSVFAGDLQQAVRAGEAAIELGPSFALGYLVLGMARLFSGHAAEAVEPLEHGIQLSPFDPQNFVWFQMLALALFFAGQREAALRAALRALKIRPSSQPTLEKVVMCSVALGRIEEARTLNDQIRHLDKPALDMFAQLKAHNPLWAEEMSALLQDPALSERPTTPSVPTGE